MRRISTVLKTYPLVVATLVVAAIGLILLTTPAAPWATWLVGGYALLIAAWEAVAMIRQLLRGHAGLDILAVTAVTAAVLVGEPWAALVVVLMLTGGAALEDYAEHRSKRELTKLLSNAPQHATRVLGTQALAGATNAEFHVKHDQTPGHSPDVAHDDPQPETSEPGTEDIPVADVQVGDVLLVKPGALAPVDAILLSEHAVFDESSLTGESLPVERVAGERVPSGAVNGQTAVTLRAAALAAESEYQHIVRLVEQAAQSKAKVVRLADRYAVPFTVLALVIAGLAWAVSGDPVRFAEVLVVATPCPLLIAAPVAFLGGMSRAARFGLIVKGGGTLEQLSRVRSAAFDKTGTITTGQPILERIVPAHPFSADDVLSLAASAEVYSSHVLADAVVKAAKQRRLPIHTSEQAEEIATNGVAAVIQLSGAVQPVTVRVGKPSWVAEFASELTQPTLSPGELAIYIGVDEQFAGVVVMRDQTREDAGEALTALRELGVNRTLMVTGDVAATAEPIAHRLGISEVHAECRPADKVRIVSEVQPRPLIMVGDGLNDAPVLAAADVGFAMGARGATAASESADIVNRYDTLASLPLAVKIGKDTVRIALQSIWLGILISVGLMLVAAFGYLPALLGAWLQEVVDLVAILGALRALGPRHERRRSR